MFLEDLSNVPVQVTNPEGFVEAIQPSNNSGNPVFVKLYNSTAAPTASSIPEFSWDVADGTSNTKVVGQIFSRGCWIAASTTTGASLTDIGTGLDVNISGLDVQPTPVS